MCPYFQADIEKESTSVWNDIKTIGKAENLIYTKGHNSKYGYKNIEYADGQHKCFVDASFLAMPGRFVSTLLLSKVLSKCWSRYRWVWMKFEKPELSNCWICSKLL